MSFGGLEHPHRRFNPLRGDWVLVSPHRAGRPWLGRRETRPERAVSHDPTCCLCPGNPRATGVLNPLYESTFVFPNDFSALASEAEVAPESVEDPLFRRMAVEGECRVICYSPRHDRTMAELTAPEIEAVTATWVEQTVELGSRYLWAQVFENKGEIMGCSNPHPHGQIWAGNWLPAEAERESKRQREYFEERGVPLLVDYVERERSLGERVAAENDGWLAVAPYWATWPFETLLMPKRVLRRLSELTSADRRLLASVLKDLLRRYDGLFDVSFPYSMGWHGAPFDGEHPEWLLHAHFYPPLLRSATIRKFMVGYEMLAEAQRDMTPEEAARRLREIR